MKPEPMVLLEALAYLKKRGWYKTHSSMIGGYYMRKGWNPFATSEYFSEQQVIEMAWHLGMKGDK